MIPTKNAVTKSVYDCYLMQNHAARQFSNLRINL